MSTAKEAPLTWSETSNISWKTPIPGLGWSSPVLSGGKIYLTTAVIIGDGSETNPQAQRSLRALCIDAAKGSIDWDTEIFTQGGAAAPGTIHKKNSHASPTPIVADGKVYVHFGHQGTAALTTDGKVLWKQVFPYSPQHGNGSSPVLHEGKLIFSCDSREVPFIVALNAKNGETAWKVDRTPTDQKQKFSFATCTAHQIGGKWQIVSPAAGAVDGLDPATGQMVWRVRYEGYSVVPGAVMAPDGLLYLTSAYDTPDVYCINPAKGTGDITDTGVVWMSGEKAPKTVSLTVVGNEVYWVSDSRGLVTCADRKTGTICWSERTPLDDCSASPVVAAGRLYITDERGQTLVIKPGRTFEKLAFNSVGDRTLASLAVSEKVLFQRTATALWRIEQK